MKLVTVERHGRVALLTLADPARRNILSSALCAELSAAVAQAEADEGVNALVITGSGPAFSAGADLGDLRAAVTGDTAAIEAVYRSFTIVANSPLPTIAAVNGAAVGAGLNLALACDVRVASEDALFDTRFLKIGLHPGGGHGWLLQRAVGWAQATQMLLFGREIRGEEARQIGLVQQLATATELVETAVTLGRRTDAVPRELLLRTKASLRLSAASAHEAAMTHETTEQFWSLGEPAFTELLAGLQAKIAKR